MIEKGTRRIAAKIVVTMRQAGRRDLAPAGLSTSPALG
jgi:hypothetical protein